MFAWVAEGGGCVSARRPTCFLLLRQKKVGKEKATPLAVSLRSAAGNLRCSRERRCRRTRCALAALRSDNCGKSDHEAWASFGAPARLTRCASRHVQRGWESDSGHRCARPRVARCVGWCAGSAAGAVGAGGGFAPVSARSANRFVVMALCAAGFAAQVCSGDLLAKKPSSARCSCAGSYQIHTNRQACWPGDHCSVRAPVAASNQWTRSSSGATSRVSPSAGGCSVSFMRRMDHSPPPASVPPR